MARRTSLRTDGLRLFFRSRALGMTRAPVVMTRVLRRREARLWVDGKAGFTRIMRCIGAAQDTVHIRMFIWKNDATGRMVRDGILRAADRGVKVLIEKEASGDLFEVDEPFLETQQNTDIAWQTFWRHPRITTHYMARRDHAKFYIIDGHVTLLTGMNIADEYRTHWHDYLIELRGSCFASELLTGQSQRPVSDPIHIITNDHDAGSIRKNIEQALRAAQRSIVIEHCYFTDRGIADLLIQRSQEGIRCIVILPRSPDASRHATHAIARHLHAQGESRTMKIFLAPKMFHAKAMLIDGKTAIIGSANLNTLSLDQTGEACVLLKGKLPSIRRLRRALRHSLLQSEVMTESGSRFFSRVLAIMGLTSR